MAADGAQGRPGLLPVPETWLGPGCAGEALLGDPGGAGRVVFRVVRDPEVTPQGVFPVFCILALVLI